MTTKKVKKAIKCKHTFDECDYADGIRAVGIVYTRYKVIGGMCPKCYKEIGESQ